MNPLGTSSVIQALEGEVSGRLLTVVLANGKTF